MTSLEGVRMLAEAVGDGIERPEAAIEHGRLVVRHPLLDGTSYSPPGIAGCVDDAGDPNPEAVRHMEDAVRDVRRRHRREILWRTNAAEGSDRPWDEAARPPSWAAFTHPLFSYALRMNGANDLTGEALAAGSSPAPGVRLRLVQDLVVGRALLDPAHPSAGKVGCDDLGVTLVLQAEIPETAMRLLAGRALGALLQLRPCGDAHLDAMVSATPIRTVERLDDGTGNVSMTFVPVLWVAPCEAPLGVQVAEMRRDAPTR